MEKQKKQQTLSEKKRHQLMKIASYSSVITAVILIIIKVISFFMTNSLAILSSLMDSGLDFGASVVSLIAIHQSLIPADKEHRFGHGKAEALGALAQGIIICFSGIFLFYETLTQIFNPKPLQRFDIGVIVMLISIVITLILVLFQRFVIKKTNSISINADNAHYIGVILSMICSYLLGWSWLDAIFALCVSVFLFYSAYKIIFKVQSILMDKELPIETRKKIKQIVLNHALISNIYDLRTRNSGQNSFIQFSVSLNGNYSLQTTHDLCNNLEQEIKQFVPNCEIFIHPEPKNEK